jgi:hypothetical protein
VSETLYSPTLFFGRFGLIGCESNGSEKWRILSCLQTQLCIACHDLQTSWYLYFGKAVFLYRLTLYYL